MSSPTEKPSTEDIRQMRAVMENALEVMYTLYSHRGEDPLVAALCTEAIKELRRVLYSGY